MSDPETKKTLDRHLAKNLAVREVIMVNSNKFLELDKIYMMTQKRVNKESANKEPANKFIVADTIMPRYNSKIIDKYYEVIKDMKETDVDTIVDEWNKYTKGTTEPTKLEGAIKFSDSFNIYNNKIKEYRDILVPYYNLNNSIKKEKMKNARQQKEDYGKRWFRDKQQENEFNVKATTSDSEWKTASEITSQVILNSNNPFRMRYDLGNLQNSLRDPYLLQQEILTKEANIKKALEIAPG